jgi:hypothetical protein
VIAILVDGRLRLRLRLRHWFSSARLCFLLGGILTHQIGRKRLTGSLLVLYVRFYDLNASERKHVYYFISGVLHVSSLQFRYAIETPCLCTVLPRHTWDDALMMPWNNTKHMTSMHTEK